MDGGLYAVRKDKSDIKNTFIQGNRKPAGIAYNNVKSVLFEKHDPVFYIRKAAVRNAKNYCFWMNPKSNNWKGLAVAYGSGQCIGKSNTSAGGKGFGEECC